MKKSGTLYATPVALGVAATVLEIASQYLRLPLRDYTCSTPVSFE